MYQASTVLTGSEMPALSSIGCCAAAGRHPKTRSAKPAAKMPAAHERLVVCIVTLLSNRVADRRSDVADRSKIPEQPAKSLDAIVDAAAPQRIPYDRLVRRHHVDAEFALEHVDRFRRRPMRRRQQNRVGVGVLAHELAPHVERGVPRNTSDLIEGA